MPAGRPPKPTALKVLQGNPGRRPLNKKEPKPDLGYPEPQEWLWPEAKKAYADLAPKLVALGMLTNIDWMTFGAMLNSYAIAIKADKTLLKEGLEIKCAAGGKKQHPSLQTRSNAWKSVYEWCREYGMTPASRTRIEIEISSGNSNDKDSPEDKAFFAYRRDA